MLASGRGALLVAAAFAAALPGAAGAVACDLEGSCAAKGPIATDHALLQLRANTSRASKKASLKAMKDKYLPQHNMYRCMHKAPLMTWDDAIAANAQKWADKTGGNMEHSPNDQRENVGGHSYLGENLAKGIQGAGAVDAWYSEIEYTNGGLVSEFGHNTGHYTQVVWEASTALGCGEVGNLAVCQYGPGGNMGNQFTQNVKAPEKAAEDCASPGEDGNVEPEKDAEEPPAPEGGSGKEGGSGEPEEEGGSGEPEEEGGSGEPEEKGGSGEPEEEGGSGEPQGGSGEPPEPDDGVEVEPPPPAEGAKFEKLEGKDTRGNDIKCGGLTSLEDIKAACAADEKCKGFSIYNGKPWCQKHKIKEPLVNDRTHVFYKKG